MAFDSLTEKLQNVFKGLRGKGVLKEADIKAAMREVKLALLEADVNFKVVKSFIKDVSEKAVGEDVMNGLNPGQMVVKIVRDELQNLLGGQTAELKMSTSGDITVIMMVGLQGSGKTTTASKLAYNLKSKGKKPLLVALDIYRPAAIEQLKVNGAKANVPVFSMGTDEKPVDIAIEAIKHAKSEGLNVVILDTAGRLQIDEALMDELKEIKSEVNVSTTLLVVDSMTGQEAVNVADTFNKEIGIDGTALTKLDGDARGGAALSIRAVTDVPIMFAGMGEKLGDLEVFHPDRMTSRILGMGDVMSLIEKAEQNIDIENAAELQNKIKKAKFDFNDYLESMKQMRKMGGISSILGMLPGLGINKAQLENVVDEKKLKQTEAIIYSMTEYERTHPDDVNMSRRTRIAKGSGMDVNEVNRFFKQFKTAQKQMKQMTGMFKKGKHGKGLKGMKLPFGL